MLNKKEQNESKFIIPKWFSLEKAIERNELKSHISAIDLKAKFDKKIIVQELEAFRKNKNNNDGVELLGLAILIEDKEVISEVNDYLIKNFSELSLPVQNLVMRNRKTVIEKDNSYDNIESKISALKKHLQVYNRDSLNWLELARLYTIIGLLDKARKSVIIALNLSPTDRYIIRSAARFFIHNDERDIAWSVAKDASRMVSDPWIYATEANIASLNDKPSIKNIKKLIPKDLNLPQLFHFSELIETYGMFELQAGNSNRAKKQFKHAWQNPSNNVVTHGEWIIRNMLPELNKDTNLDFSKSREAFSWRLYQNLEFERALNETIEWELEEPYSVDPYSLGSNIACVMGNYSRAIKILGRGLKSNPNDNGLLNNLAYSYLSLNQVQEAENVIRKFSNNTGEYDQVFIKATTGYLNYKKNNVAFGRELYIEAIDLAKKLKDQILAQRALVHFVLAEIEYNPVDKKTLIEDTIKQTEKSQDPDIIELNKKLKKYL